MNICKQFTDFYLLRISHWSGIAYYRFRQLLVKIHPASKMWDDSTIYRFMICELNMGVYYVHKFIKYICWKLVSKEYKQEYREKLRECVKEIVSHLKKREK